jgi:hypothetical protein
MSIDSYLSSPDYGYDLVVATTERGINATIKEFLNERKESVVRYCVAVDDNDNPYEIAYEDLMLKTGCDPFKVAENADPASDPDLKKLYDFGFLAGFQAQLGIPLGYTSPDEIPKIVTFQPDHASVLLQLMCAEFTIVELSNGRKGVHWTSVSQGNGTPWLFTSNVALRMDSVPSETTTGLTSDVLAAAQNLKKNGEVFSIRRLLFDFASAAIQTEPTITGVDPGSKAHALLTQYFLGSYLSMLQQDGGPLLGAALIPNEDTDSSLSPTNVIQRICPPVPVPPTNPPLPPPPTTLALIAAVDDDVIPPNAKPFAWNWVDGTEGSDAHGVIAVNRTKYANFWSQTLKNYVETCCFLPQVCASFVPGRGLEFDLQSNLTPFQTPQVSIPTSGPVVLSYRHAPAQSEAGVGVNDLIGKFKMGTSFTLDVSFTGKSIVISQHLVIYLYVWSGPCYHEGNIVDKLLVDTFEISVAGGQLQSSLTSTSTDTSVAIDLNSFDKIAVPGLEDWVSGCETAGSSIKANTMRDIPVADVSRFVFPGGRSFVFKEAAFSSHQDLVCFITYADPN